MLQTLKRGLGRSYRLLNQNRIARKLASWAALPDGSGGVNSASDISRRLGEERAQFYETSTGRYYLPTDAPQDCVINCIKSGGVYEPEVVETAKAYIRPGSYSARCWREFRPNVSPLFAIRRCRRTRTFLRGGSFCLRTPSKNSSSEQLPECNGSPGAVYDRPNQQLFYPVQDFKRFAALRRLWY